MISLVLKIVCDFNVYGPLITNISMLFKPFLLIFVFFFFLMHYFRFLGQQNWAQMVISINTTTIGEHNTLFYNNILNFNSFITKFVTMKSETEIIAVLRYIPTYFINNKLKHPAKQAPGKSEDDREQQKNFNIIYNK